MQLLRDKKKLKNNSRDENKKKNKKINLKSNLIGQDKLKHGAFTDYQHGICRSEGAALDEDSGAVDAKKAHLGHRFYSSAFR